MLRGFLTSIILLVSIICTGQNKGADTPETHCTSPEERLLFNLISEYRNSNNLPQIELSRSLSYVAKTHAKDLSINRPDFGGCNPHSWSSKGKWKACCYAQDNNRLNCMTLKPKELTSYKFKAYEVVYSSGEEATAHDAFALWKDIGMMNDYLLNKGKWTKPWQAIGVGIYGEYACVWFGEGDDVLNAPFDCGSDTVKSVSTVQEIIVQTSTEQLDYFIIISSTSSEDQAKKEVKRLREKGFPNALYLRNPSFFRIATHKFNNEAAAYKELEKVKVQYPSAWLLKPQNNK